MIEHVRQGRRNELAVEHRWPDEEPRLSYVPREDDEGLARWERRSRLVTVAVGAAFLTIGVIGFLVRLALK